MVRRNTILVSRTLYQVGVITLIAAIFWLVIGIYLALAKSSPVDVDPGLLEPLNPVIDQKVVISLSKRSKVEEVFLDTQEATPSAAENVIINKEETR